jgi:hypothetical protein
VSVAEGGATADYTVRLSSQPAGPVTVTVTPDAQCTVSAAALTFDAATWTVEQPVTVTAVDDAAAEGNHTCAIANTAAGADPHYQGLNATVSAAVADNDAAGVNFDPPTIVLVEGAPAPASYQVWLGSQPQAGETLTVGLTYDSSQFTALPAALTFDATNWNVPQTIQVEAIYDGVDEPGVIAYAIQHTLVSSLGGASPYNGLVVTVQVDLVDTQGQDAVPGYYVPPCDLSDGRLNDDPTRDCAPPVVVYCQGSGVDVYLIDVQTSSGVLWVRLTEEEIEAAGVPGDAPITLAERAPVIVSRLPGGYLQVNSWSYDPYWENNAKPYILAWDACPASDVRHISN